MGCAALLAEALAGAVRLLRSVAVGLTSLKGAPREVRVRRTPATCSRSRTPSESHARTARCSFG